VKFSEHIEEKGKAFFQAAKKKGLEGSWPREKRASIDLVERENG